MRILLWGCGENSIRIKKYLDKFSDTIEVIGWCDKKYETINQKDELQVFSPMEAVKLYKERKIDAILPTVKPRLLNSIVRELYKNGVNECYYVFENDLHEQNENELNIRKITTEKPSLEYYEFHVCDHCNLNCKGCLHLANACDEKFANLNQYICDMNRMKELFSSVHSIKLLGGEPLLNKDLCKFIEITKSTFPECELRVATNGILLNEKCTDLFECMKKNDASFFISLYPPVKKIRYRIEQLCKNNGIKCIFTEEINAFRKQFCINGGNDIKQSFNICRKQMGFCFGLREGKLSPCVATYIRFLNEKYDTHIPITKDDEFDIYSSECNGWDLIKKLYEPIPLCAYCGIPQEFKWECGSVAPPIEEYIL